MATIELLRTHQHCTFTLAHIVIRSFTARILHVRATCITGSPRFVSEFDSYGAT